MSTPAELFDRRQRALEAAWDTDDRQDGIATAIETATRVRVDKDVCAAAWRAHEARTAPMEGSDDPEFISMLIAAFEAAGFEVEE